MKCPVCQISLVMSERAGIEIDYCPECRGVWLDRGELDKIIERTLDFDDDDYRPRKRSSSRPQYDDDYYDKPKRDYRYKKRKSPLAEIFDIFD